MTVRRSVLPLTLLAMLAAPAAAQGSLDAAVETARQAWLGHDARRLVATSDTVRLRIPGVAVNDALRPGQAARLLGEYFSQSEEETFELVEIRPAGEGHAYAELERRHAIRGTTDYRQETVFLGFRRVEGRWRLREVRIAP